MRPFFMDYFKKSWINFFEAVANIIIFLPYFFSIPALVRTLFSPWKKIASKKTAKGFSPEEWFNRVTYNYISRSIGFIMRISVILFYFIIQGLFIIILPAVSLFYLVAIPFFYLKSNLEKNEDEKKDRYRLEFIGKHLLNQDNYNQVASWFEKYYLDQLKKTHWWKKENLFSLPPVARDWANGFTPILDEYTKDLTSSVYQSNIKNIVDREKEITQMERILSKGEEANVIICGEDGIGKHTVVDALSKRIYEGNTNTVLMYKRILKLNMEMVLSGYTDQKQREHFLELLFDEAANAGNIILFIDDIDRFTVSSQDRVDISVPLEKYIKYDNFGVIGITTPFYYQKYIFPNSKIHRFFTRVDVYEADTAEAMNILLDIAPSYEKRYNLYIPYETIKEAVVKSDFYITSIPFPEKAIELLDLSCIYAIDKLKKTNIVTPKLIDSVLSEKTHIPTTITDAIKEKLIHLEELLRRQIVYQEEPVKKVSSALRRSFLLIGKRKKPLASFLFLGPTGVGKTETAKAIARIFFGSEINLIRFDMSFYQTKEDVGKLIGSGENGSPGIMTKTLRDMPYGVLLLDEIEKADHDLLNIFLTMLDEGYIIDGFGKRVDCKNLVIIATSNAGSNILYDGSTDKQSLIKYLIDERIFSPEFLNRFDDIISYKSLDEKAVAEIAKKMLESISSDIVKLHKVKLSVSDRYISDLIKSGYRKEFGARNLDRLIRDNIEDKVAKLILEGKVKEGETIIL